MNLEKLEQPLDPSRKEVRKTGFGSVEYLPVHDVIQHANEIFGYDNWSSSILDWEWLGTEKKGNKFYASVRCICEVQVGDQVHQDIGVGSSTRESEVEAKEGAAKNAASDGIKRALRAWGNQFGLHLSDSASINKESSSQQGQSGGSSKGSSDKFDKFEVPQNEPVTHSLVKESVSWQEDNYGTDKSISPKQIKSIKALFSSANIPKERQHEILSDWVGRDIGSTKDLYIHEASGILNVAFQRQNDFIDLVSKDDSGGVAKGKSYEESDQSIDIFVMIDVIRDLASGEDIPLSALVRWFDAQSDSRSITTLTDCPSSWLEKASTEQFWTEHADGIKDYMEEKEELPFDSNSG